MSTEITSEFVWHNIPPRPRDSHKGSFGTVLAVAGSAYYRGAALLATEGALRTGAGIVTLASVEPVLAAAVARLPECCLCPCVAGAEGGISPESIPQLQRQKATVLLLGRAWRYGPEHSPRGRNTHAGAEASARLCRQRGAGCGRPERRRAAAAISWNTPPPGGRADRDPAPRRDGPAHRAFGGADQCGP